MNHASRKFALSLGLAVSIRSGLAAQVLVQTFPFRVSSVGSSYPVAVAVLGTYRVFPDSVVVEVDSGEVVNQVPKEFGERGRIWGITVAAELGKGTAAGWDSEGESRALKLAGTLQIGERVRFEAMRFTITHTDTLRLRERWLVIELGVQQDFGASEVRAGPLFSYACTEDNVMGPTPASRARALAQRKRYAVVC